MIDTSLFTNKKVAFYTLGCKLNFTETSYIGKQLTDSGYSKVKQGEQADICIVNTCSVTDIADHKSRQTISRIHRKHPNAKIVVTGCYAQLKPEEISKINGVDLVLGANEKFDMLKYLKQIDHDQIATHKVINSDILKVKRFRPSISHDDRTRYFLKVQDGCDYYCTYCTIPFARGHSRSGTIAETTAMACNAVEEGAKEIILTGVNTGEFGKQHNETFLQLVENLDKIDADVRFRISSIEPNLLSDEIIDFVANSKRFMPHFHIPLQSGNNQVLKLMKRRYTTELFAEKLSAIKLCLPHAFIGVDVIVGVRGETDELFGDSVRFIESVPFSQLHVFTYSERANTKMMELEHIVPKAERKRRSELLHKISENRTISFYENQIGKTAQVLWEAKEMGNAMQGFTENYVRVERPFDKTLINTIETITLGGWNGDKSALKVSSLSPF